VAKFAFRPEPRLLETEIDKPEIALGITKKDEQNRKNSASPPLGSRDA
jgi:hypothetical protein